MLHELGDMSWDVILFSETRAETDDVLLDGGHRLILYRNEYYASGVGILIHARHTNYVKAIHRISDRILCVDMEISGKVLDLIADLEFDAMQNHMQCIVGGDFNAKIDIAVRGKRLRDFISECNLTIANDPSELSMEDTWTYHSLSWNSYLQLDYIFLGRGLHASRCEAVNLLNMGSDHRAVRCDIPLSRPMQVRKSRPKQHPWKRILKKSEIKSSYHQFTLNAIHEREISDLQDMENILVECAHSCINEKEPYDSNRKPWQNQDIRRMIQNRRSERDYTRRKALSRDIHKKVRQELRKWKTMRAQSILQKFE
eukprot:6900361-Karenia_brevis.AAC.1